MLTQRYMPSIKNLKEIFAKIVEGAPPERFNLEHLNGLGFSSSNDRAVIPILKDLTFLDAEGRPTQRYRDFRDRSRSKSVMGDALKDAYGDLFLIRETGISKADRDAIMGKFKSVHGSTDRVAEVQAMTFLALLELADFSGSHKPSVSEKSTLEIQPSPPMPPLVPPPSTIGKDLSLSYKIEVHLPATRDIETYHAIFKSLREHLLND